MAGRTYLWPPFAKRFNESIMRQLCRHNFYILIAIVCCIQNARQKYALRTAGVSTRLQDMRCSLTPITYQPERQSAADTRGDRTCPRAALLTLTLFRRVYATHQSLREFYFYLLQPRK